MLRKSTQPDRLALVRELVQAERSGVLATLSVRHDGWPFASVAPYALTEQREPLLLLSQLAEHTRNVRADPRASLFVQRQGADDVQAASRVTLMGQIEHVGRADWDRWTSLRNRYIEWHPQAEDTFTMTDFGLYVLRIAHIRFVAGFGEMGWLSAPFD